MSSSGRTSVLAFSHGESACEELEVILRTQRLSIPFYRLPTYSYLHRAQWLNYPSRAKIHGAPTCKRCIVVVGHRNRWALLSLRRSKKRLGRNSRITLVCCNGCPKDQNWYRSSLALGAFLYAYGSAGTNSTHRANQRAFQKFGIIPRMLVNATRRSLEVGELSRPQLRAVS